ncbi:hypothetical protein CRENBAI_024424 [Crenichthys baileyi]|uniref:Uncharacterized protein n=1 Tax=Crenichthys baileyi TaxID=28760 RepID=A0AAV9QZH7_9TELE
MFPPNFDLADKQKDDALDRWVERQKEEAMRNLPTDLEVLPSPLLLEQMDHEAVQRQRVREGCSVPPPQLRRSPPASVPAAKPSSSSRRRNRQRAGVNSQWAGEEVVSLSADMRAAASKPAPSSATAMSPRLPAAPPIPSSARCSEATPEELEERLRFFARQIKSFRKTSLLYFSPEQMQIIKQMEEDYETAVSRALLLLLSSPLSGLQSAAAAVEQSTPGLQPAGQFPEGPVGGLPPRPGPEHLLGFLWGVLTELRPDAQPDSRPDSPQPGMMPDPKSASTSSTRRRGRRKRGASAQFIEGLCDASAPAHATEGPGDASAPAHATEGPGDASAPAHATEGPGDASAPAHATEGPGDASAPAHATERLSSFWLLNPETKVRGGSAAGPCS